MFQISAGCPGVLIVKRAILPALNSPPTEPGGGTVFYVTEDTHRYLISLRYKIEWVQVIGRSKLHDMHLDCIWKRKGSEWGLREEGEGEGEGEGERLEWSDGWRAKECGRKIVSTLKLSSPRYWYIFIIYGDVMFLSRIFRSLRKEDLWSTDFQFYSPTIIITI